MNSLAFENIIDTIDDIIFCKDLNFKYIACNDAFCKLIGKPKNKILGKDDFALFSYETANFIRLYDEKVLKDSKAVKAEHFIRNVKKEKRLIQTKKSLIRNSKNQPLAIFGIARDITETVKIDKKLKESEKTYIELFQANKIPVLIIDLKTKKILDANKASLNFYKYTYEELTSLKISDINTLTPKEIEKEMKLAHEEKRDCFLFKHKLANNEILNVEVYSGPLKFKNKDVLYSLIHDVTPRIKAQEKLRQAYTIFENTKEGIFITDLDGKIQSVNKAFSQITGYKKEDIIGLSPSFLKSYEHPKEFYENLWNSIKENNFWEGEVINKKANGELCPKWLTITTVFDENNNPSNYIAVFTDFSKIKEQEQLLRVKDKIMTQQSKMAAMGEMLRNIAHQWRQPLNVMSTVTSALKFRKEIGDLKENDIDRFCDNVLESISYLSETINDFSNFFKNQNEKFYFNINEAINKSIQLSIAMLQEEEIIIKQDSFDYKIYGIQNELVQVLLNLINNSKDAFCEHKIKKKIINITLNKDSNNLFLSIKDNAGGIPKEIMEKVFDMEFTTKDATNGSGIGLYMSKQIIEEHLEGKLYVNNHKKNGKISGATFTIKIPIKDNE